MKNLTKHCFAANNARMQWNEYNNLLCTKTVLSERKDVLPFFQRSYDLSLLIGRYFPKTASANCFAHEFDIYGDFVADLIVGDSRHHRYVLVEFEDGKPDSIFRTRANKATPEWSPRFEGAYSQLVDWLWKLEDMRSTSDFTNTFGSRRASFHGLIVIGKEMNLARQEQDRLDWRSQKTMIDSTAIEIISFDQLKTDFNEWLTEYYNV